MFGFRKLIAKENASFSSELLRAIRLRSEAAPFEVAAPGVAVLGNFDGFHIGHQELFRVAREIADRANCQVVLLSIEPHPREVIRGERRFRIYSCRDKYRVAQSLEIDEVQEATFTQTFSSMSPSEFVERVLVRGLICRHVVVGYDYRFGAGATAGVKELARLLAGFGTGCTIIEPQTVSAEVVSSSAIRLAISEGDIERANRLLGRNWSFTLPDTFERRRNLFSVEASALDTVLPPAGKYLVRLLDRPSCLTTLDVIGEDAGARLLINAPPPASAAECVIEFQ